MIYLPELSIQENAQRNNVTVAAVRKYIQEHNIDRRGDELVRRQKRVLKLYAQGKTIREIIGETGYSYNTIKKYLSNFDAKEIINKDKISSLDNGKNASVIKSYSYNQTEILQNILRLYIGDTRFDCDLTFSQGAFYRFIEKPKLKFDKFPLYDDVQPLSDAENLTDSSLNSVVIDLPFLIKPINNNWCIKDRFLSFTSVEEMQDTYQYMMELGYRLLRKGGYLIVKTQDTSQGSKSVWTHFIAESIADTIGFALVDMFILMAKAVILRGKMEEQHKARKYHSYFYIFQK